MKSIIRAVLLSLALVAVAAVSRAVEHTWNYAVQVSATVQASPAKITLSWPQDTVTTPSSYVVYRKSPGATSWGAGTTLPGTTTSWSDTSVATGTAYEYKIVKTAGSVTGYGYIQSGINVPLVDQRGKVILVVDNTHAAALAAELARLEQDLIGDGWQVVRHDVSRSDSVASVKSRIVATYNADPANVKSVFLFGRIPVPYSGKIVPDGHSDHTGAWPADAYYGDMDGAWTDSSVNYTQSINTDPADAARLTNRPGDGKFDQSTMPSAIELQVGRVDLANMPGKTAWNSPATFATEVELLRQYLNKDHAFRNRLVNPQRRAIIGDYFGTRSGEAFAASGYRAAAALVGSDKVTNLNVLHNDQKGVWVPALAGNDYLFAYGTGAGSYKTVAGLGNVGKYFDTNTVEIVNSDVKAVFTLMFGSWFGDWDHEDSVLRSILATKSLGLTAAWSGRPHWFIHPMGLGEPIGVTAKLTQNNTGLYQNQQNNAANHIHIALMGDPTLRLHAVAPVGSVSASASGATAVLSWAPSPDDVIGYHVYRATSANGLFTRLTTSPVAALTYTDSSAPAGATYMVRAVKLETSASGSYFNASQGRFYRLNAGTPTLPTQPPAEPPPVVKLEVSSPVNSTSVAGSIPLTVSVPTTQSVASVQFLINGAPVGSELTKAPFTRVWDTTGFVNGTYAISAVLRDGSGVKTTLAASTITVANATPGTATITAPVSTTDRTGPNAVTISAADSLAAIGTNDFATITFTRTGSTKKPLPVAFTFGGSAVKWTDYRTPQGGLPNEIVIPAGLDSISLDIAALANSRNANPHTIDVTLDDEAGYTVLSAGNTYTKGATASVRLFLSAVAPAPATPVTSSAPSPIVVAPEDVQQPIAASPTEPATEPSPVPVIDSGITTLTVTATDATGVNKSDDYATFTFTRTGSTAEPLLLKFTLGGTAVKWTDYRRPEGDMPVQYYIPAGLASATMNLRGMGNVNNVNPQTIVVTLASGTGYEVGSAKSGTVTLLPEGSAATPTTTPSTGTSTLPVTSPTGPTSPEPTQPAEEPVTEVPSAPAPAVDDPAPAVSVVDYTKLVTPSIGSNTMHILSPTTIELVRINTQPKGGVVDSWNFVDSAGNLAAPAGNKFVVTVGGQPVAVQSVGFKRRPLYAPLNTRDLRISNTLVLQLAAAIEPSQVVAVTNPDGTLWPSSMEFKAVAHAQRYSPAIHVNQEGYVPAWPKKASVSYYLGNLGELAIPALSFSLVDAYTGVKVFEGALQSRLETGWNITPTPYQKVYEADFSSFAVPGEYKLVVPGLGASLPFLIDEGIGMSFARTYAQGLFHQRCGHPNHLPFTRHTHEACHTAPASVPTGSLYAFTWKKIAELASTINKNNPPQIAPALTSEAAMLYPFVNLMPVDVSGGHHDAGDYSKYTINSASMLHALMFNVDSVNGVAAFDNLGLPESGDGISDILQEAKIEADFLAKMQDADGGFYFLVYPRDRAYESNVLPDRGDPQVVWPKNTSATAAAVAALAETASSPRFRAAYPHAAALYLEKAKLGWQFLQNAIARYGKAGSYQKITHYGDDFTHDDELAWAAAAMFAATGDQGIHATLKSWFDPSSPSTWRWGWVHAYSAYGNAVRSYAFAARSGRISAAQLDPVFLAKTESEVRAAGNDALKWTNQSAFGTAFPDNTKRQQSAGWYFSTMNAFDITVAYQLDGRGDYFDAIVRNVNYEAGSNALNLSFITGLGWKRQKEIVHQYALNDDRVLPPNGIPLGNLQTGPVYTGMYGTELAALTYPRDNASSNPHGFYDRWTDTHNVTTEFVHIDQARSLGLTAHIAALTSVKTQAWKPVQGAIVGVPSAISVGTPITVSLQAPAGIDLDGARIVWEAKGSPAAYGESYTFTPSGYGSQWVEAEAQLPDGRRVVARSTLFAENGLPTVTVVAADAVATIGSTTDTATWTFTRAGSTAEAITVNFKLAGSAVKFTDYRRLEGDMPQTVTIPAGAASGQIVIRGVQNSTNANPHFVELSLASGTNYNVGAVYSATVNFQR